LASQTRWDMAEICDIFQIASGALSGSPAVQHTS
jgi:hypothetical protein